MSKKDVMIVTGAGQISMAIVRRVGYGKKIVMGDKNINNAKKITEIMNNAGFDVEPVEMDLSSRESILKLIAKAQEYIIEEMWSKFLLNVCNNLPQAVLGVGVGCYQDSIHMKQISNGLRQELEAIAEAKGIDISKADASSSRGSAVPPTARYSTLQDLDAGRHTEIDMFSGALVRMGKELGIPTPYNEYTYHIIKAMEEKNDGKFDYSKDSGEVTCSR